MTIAFSQEEWGLLDAAERLLYCEVMLEICTLVASVGKTLMLFLASEVMPCLPFAPAMAVSAHTQTMGSADHPQSLVTCAGAELWQALPQGHPEQP